MFAVNTAREFKKSIIASHFGFVFEQNFAQGNHMIIVPPSISRSSVFRMFFVHTKTKSRRFQIPPVSRKSSFEKLRSRDGLVWSVGLIVEIKLRFKISLA